MTEQGVVLQGTGGVWSVRTSDGATRDVSLRGRLKISADKLAVGDEVVLEDAGGAWAIAEILPRRSVLARRSPVGSYGERIVGEPRACGGGVDEVNLVHDDVRLQPVRFGTPEKPIEQARMRLGIRGREDDDDLVDVGGDDPFTIGAAR